MPPAWRGAASTRPDFSATILTRRRTRDRTTRSTSGSRERLLAPPSPTAPVLAAYTENIAQRTNTERRCPRLGGEPLPPVPISTPLSSPDGEPATGQLDQQAAPANGCSRRLHPQRPSWLCTPSITLRELISSVDDPRAWGGAAFGG